MARWPFNSPEWRHARRVTLARSGGVCEVRGPNCTTLATEADHYPKPLSVWLDEFGGQQSRDLLRLVCDPNNLRAACKRCNAGLGARLGAARRWAGRPRAQRTTKRRTPQRRVTREWLSEDVGTLVTARLVLAFKDRRSQIRFLSSFLFAKAITWGVS